MGHLSIIREFLNGPRPPGGSSASAEPPHSPADRTQTAHTHGRTAQRYRRTNRHKRYRRTHGGDRGWRWVQHERETVRRPTSHERAVRVLVEPSITIARVACIFGLTARVRLLAPSAPVPGLAPAQIPPKGGLGPRREGKSGSGQKVTSGFRFPGTNMLHLAPVTYSNLWLTRWRRYGML